MRKFRRTIYDFFQQTRRLWLALLVLIFLLFCIMYFGFYTYLTTDSNSALYLLSTIAQSSASIIAIVISLSLLVVQYSASTYSARVVDIFKNDLRLWALIFFYGFSIIFSLIVIRLIKDSSNGYLYLGINCLEICYTLALLLSIAAYISLIAYIPYVLKMMKSSSVIDLLSDKIDIKSLSNSSSERYEHASQTPKHEPRINRMIINLNDEEDPFLPIIDIIRASIMRYDYATARYGLGAVTYRLLSILIQNPLEEKRISEHVFNRIFEIWKLALRIKDSEFIYMVLVEYCYIGELCTRPVEGSDSVYINFILKLKTKTLILLHRILNKPPVEEKVAHNNLLYTTFLSEYYLKEAFKSIVEVKDEEFQNLSIFLASKVNKIGSKTFENRYELIVDKPVEVLESLESSTSEFSYILKDIGIAAINAGSESAFKVVINTFNYIGEAAIYHNLIHSTFHILENLKIIGEESAKKGEEFEPLTKQIVECLENLASKIDSHSKELAGEKQNKVVEYYEYIKLNYDTYETTEDILEALKDREELAIRHISSYVYTIGKESIRNNLLHATQQCLKSLETVERILKSGTESRHIGEDIRYLGLEAVKKEQTYPLMEDIIKSLYSIGILQFGYMFDWDRDHEKRREFLKKEYSDYLAKGLRLSYSDFEEMVDFKDTGDFSYIVYLDDIIYEEKTLIIDDKERKDIKRLYLSDIEDACFKDNTLKLFKVGVFKNSEKAYYKVPELLKELTNPILEYALNSPSDETIKPFTMIIQCFENFGIVSIHLRDEFSLNEIFIRSLVTIGDSLVYNSRHSEDSKDQKAREYLDWVATVTSNSLYNLAVLSLKCNLVDYGTLYQQMECLIRIQKEYPYSLYHIVSKFERIIEMVKESELKESERDKITTLTENVIQGFKNKKAASDGEQSDLHQKEEKSSA